MLGEALTARPARRRAQIGYMAQATVLYNELSVRENLRFRAGVMGLADAAGRSALALDEHCLDEVAQQRVGVRFIVVWPADAAQRLALGESTEVRLLADLTLTLTLLSTLSIVREVERGSWAGLLTSPAGAGVERMKPECAQRIEKINTTTVRVWSHPCPIGEQDN